MSALGREQVLAAIASRLAERHPVEVPELGGTLYMRRLSFAELEELGLTDGITSNEQLGKLLSRCIVSEDGERLFTDADAEELVRGDAEVILRLLAEAMRVQGLTTPELEEVVEGFASARRGEASSG